jgi:hypothetical protein
MGPVLRHTLLAAAARAISKGHMLQKKRLIPHKLRMMDQTDPLYSPLQIIKY